MTDNDQLPEWLQGMREGELRMRLKCDLCGRTEEGIALLYDKKVIADFNKLIREQPEDALEAVRRAIHYAAGWHSVPLPDGGTVDVCRECKRGPWVPL